MGMIGKEGMFEKLLLIVFLAVISLVVAGNFMDLKQPISTTLFVLIILTVIIFLIKLILNIGANQFKAADWIITILILTVVIGGLIMFKDQLIPAQSVFQFNLAQIKMSVMSMVGVA